MGVLGVLTCQILETEFAFLIARDPDVSAITVVEDEVSSGLIHALETGAEAPVWRIPVLRDFDRPRSPGLTVLVRVLELALHNRKHILRDALVKATKEMGRHVDAILLGYGLCGNALQNPRELLADAGVPLFIPMDQDHPVDDCVGLMIGGRERYYEEQCKEAGTFFMIDGWTRHWRKIFEKEYGSVDNKMAKRIFAHYKRSLLIPTPVTSEEAMAARIIEFSDSLGLSMEVCHGTLNLIQRAWDRSKEWVLSDGKPAA